MALSEDVRAKGTRPHWLGYIGAGDVDASLAQAVRLGARVLMPAQDMEGIGRSAVLADPQGAIFGLFRPLKRAGVEVGSDMSFTWFELATAERDSGLAFYQQLFGWTLRPPMDMGGGFFYQTFGQGTMDFGGCYTIPAERPMAPSWCPYASCASADQIANKVLQSGGKICHGPVDVPGGGRIVQFLDPEGALCAAHSMPQAVIVAAKPKVKPKVKPGAKAKMKKKATKSKRVGKKPAKNKGTQKAAKKVAKSAPRKAARKTARKTAARGATRPAAKKRAAPKKKKAARKK